MMGRSNILCKCSKYNIEQRISGTVSGDAAVIALQSLAYNIANTIKSFNGTDVSPTVISLSGDSASVNISPTLKSVTYTASAKYTGTGEGNPSFACFTVTGASADSCVTALKTLFNSSFSNKPYAITLITFYGETEDSNNAT